MFVVVLQIWISK